MCGWTADIFVQVPDYLLVASAAVDSRGEVVREPWAAYLPQRSNIPTILNNNEKKISRGDKPDSARETHFANAVYICLCKSRATFRRSQWKNFIFELSHLQYAKTLHNSY